MSTRLQTQMKAPATSGPTFTPVHSGFLQRQCACGGSPGLTGECVECASKWGQRASLAPGRREIERGGAVPSIVHEVLRSPGQALDGATRVFMESRVGHDFSQVRVHTDTKAAESAQAVHALAYTVGHHIVFGLGRYASTGDARNRLLAHELTHVMQQSHSHRVDPDAHDRVQPQVPFFVTIGSTDDPAEREADQVAAQVTLRNEAAIASPEVGSTSSFVPILRRQGDEAVLAEQQSQEVELRRLATLPHLALKQWRTLKQSDRNLVLWNMTLLYGAPFTAEFLKYANGEKKPRPGFGGALKGPQYTPKWLFDRGYRHAYGEVWVHPSGEYIWVLTPSESSSDGSGDMEKKCPNRCFLETEDEDECRECCQKTFPDEGSECRKYCDSRCADKL